MFVKNFGFILLLAGLILGDTIIKDNPAEFKAIATDGNGNQVPVTGEMDTIQVFDIHPADEKNMNPGLSIDINVSPLNSSRNGEAASRVPTQSMSPEAKYPSHGNSQSATTPTMPTDYGKINNVLPLTSNPNYPFTGQSPRTDVATPAPYPINSVLASNVPGYRKASIPASPYSFANPNLDQNPNQFSSLAPTSAPANLSKAVSTPNFFAPATSKNTNNPFNPLNPATPLFGHNPFNVPGYQNAGNRFAPTADQTANPFNLFGESSTTQNPVQPTNQPFVPSFGQYRNPFNIFNPNNTPFDQNSSPTSLQPVTSNPSVAPAFSQSANPFQPTPNPFNPLTPTSPQNMLPFGGTLFNKKNQNPTEGFPGTSTPNPFFPLFGGAGKILYGGKPNRVVGPNPEENSSAGSVASPPMDDYNDAALSNTTDHQPSNHQPSGLLRKVLNLFGSSNDSTDHKTVDYEMPSAGNSSSSLIDYSDMAVDKPSHSRFQDDFINPHIYKAYFDPTMWNKFTNITDFDDSSSSSSSSLGNPQNPFGALNPSYSPFAFMKNVNPWSPGNVNNPWNANNIYQAMLNLSSLFKAPASNFGASFGVPTSDSTNPFPWTFNASAPGQLEISSRNSTPKFDMSTILQNVNASLLPPLAFAPGAGNDATNSDKKPWPKLNLPTGPAAAPVNISNLIKMVSETVEMLNTNSSSQALVLKSLAGGGNVMNWKNSAEPEPAPSPFPSPPAPYTIANEVPGVAAKNSAEKFMADEPDLQPPLFQKFSPLDLETFPAVNGPKPENYKLSPEVSPQLEKNVGETTSGNDTEWVNSSTASEVSQNGTIAILSSWMLVIGVVVGVIMQKLCS